MGWAESRSISSEMVRKAQERITADLLAISVKEFSKSRTAANEEKMYQAVKNYEEVRYLNHFVENLPFRPSGEFLKDEDL